METQTFDEKAQIFNSRFVFIWIKKKASNTGFVYSFIFHASWFCRLESLLLKQMEYNQ